MAAIGAHDNRTDEMLELAEADTIGERIRTLREHAAMSQADLAEATGTGQSAICAIETDKREPTLAVLKRIAEALGTTVAKLLE